MIPQKESCLMFEESHFFISFSIKIHERAESVSAAEMHVPVMQMALPCRYTTLQSTFK
jgi:hypothetical protein